MTAAARIPRRLVRTPAPRRDVIGSLLFYRMDWCEQHPGVMFAALGALIVLAGVLEGLLP